MKFRFTHKELKNISNKRLLHALIEERKSPLNMYSVLRTRLNKLQEEEKLTFEDIQNEN